MRKVTMYEQGMTASGEQLAQEAPSAYDELLHAYVAGTTSPGLSLLCAAHLSLNAYAREKVSFAEEVGGALLLEEDSEGVPEMNFDAILARLDDPVEPEGAQMADGPLPGPLARAMPSAFSEIPWKFRLPGLSEHVLPGFEHEHVSLLRARPGVGVPQHTHEGLEATLILQGAMRDGTTDFRVGDLALAGPQDDHHPNIIGDKICVCLIVRDGALRFTGRFGRALNLFAE